MDARIAHDIGHARLAPARVDIGMARLTSLGADKTRACDTAGRFGRRRRGWRQMTEKQDYPPDIRLRQAPRRHRGVANSIAHESEDLSVLERRQSLPQRRRAGIDVPADRCAAAAIVAVTNRAVVLKEPGAGFEI